MERERNDLAQNPAARFAYSLGRKRLYSFVKYAIKEENAELLKKIGDTNRKTDNAGVNALLRHRACRVSQAKRRGGFENCLVRGTLKRGKRAEVDASKHQKACPDGRRVAL